MPLFVCVDIGQAEPELITANLVLPIQILPGCPTSMATLHELLLEHLPETRDIRIGLRNVEVIVALRAKETGEDLQRRAQDASRELIARLCRGPIEETSFVDGARKLLRDANRLNGRGKGNDMRSLLRDAGWPDEFVDGDWLGRLSRAHKSKLLADYRRSEEKK